MQTKNCCRSLVEVKLVPVAQVVARVVHQLEGG